MRRGLLIAAAGGSAAVLLTAGLAVAANTPGGSPTPANKAIAAGDTMEVFGPGENVTLLSASLKTSKPTDLMLHATLECSILTKLTTGPDPAQGAIDHAETTASIDGWIEIDDDNLANEATETGAPVRIVPVQSTSQPPQDGSTPQTGDEEKDGATFCNRTYARTVEDGEDPEDGIDRETDYIRTKTANAFNWVLLNAGSGIHHVRLMADLDATNANGTCSTAVDDPVVTGLSPQTCSEAHVGNRTLIIEPTKMANDAIIGNPGES